MRHYLIILIQFVLFQAEICEPEIKENLISEALVLSVSEPEYFLHIAAASGDRDILSASNEVHKAARELQGIPALRSLQTVPNFHLFHLNTAIKMLAFLRALIQLWLRDFWIFL